jgi:hypothetical protein
MPPRRVPSQESEAEGRTANLATTQTSPWCRMRLFVKAADPILLSAEKSRIRTFDWKPPAKIRFTACAMCGTRPIERIRENRTLNRLGLSDLMEMENAQLALLVNQRAEMCP